LNLPPDQTGSKMIPMAEYLKKFQASLDSSIKAGFILSED